MKKDATTAVDAELLLSDIRDLGRFGALPDGGLTRQAYSPEMTAAQTWLMGRMDAAGMAARVDGAGNVIGRLGAETGPALVCGSHIDTVPEGGVYDGALGVLAGLAAARVLAERRASMPVAFEVIAFSDEEGAFLSESGARAMVGDLGAEELRASEGRDGTSLTSALEAAGLSVESVLSARRPATDFLACLELHIEQGPILENEGLDIGVVQSVIGLHTSELVFVGQANHAGTTPVAMRRDAFRACAETVTACFDRLETSFPAEARLTFGKLELSPGATNVVPSCVKVSREIRAGSEALIESVAEETGEIAKSIAESHGVSLEIRLASREAPALLADPVLRIIETACERRGASFKRMVSGAGHDAQIMARHCPTGMIFVPSHNGISHNPAEHTSPQQIITGANVLLSAIDLMFDRFTRKGHDVFSGWQSDAT